MLPPQTFYRHEPSFVVVAPNEGKKLKPLLFLMKHNTILMDNATTISFFNIWLPIKKKNNIEKIPERESVVWLVKDDDHCQGSNHHYHLVDDHN